MKLGKPAKVFQYNGLTLNLYTSGALRRIIRRKPETLKSLEDQGFIPRPMFRAGGVRYYTDYELQALSDLNSQIGMPYKFHPGTDYEWSKELAARWAAIRSALSDGKTPPSPIYLRFEGREDLKNYLRAIFRSAGIVNESYIETMTARFMERSHIN